MMPLEGVAEHSSRLQPSGHLHAPFTAFMCSCSGTDVLRRTDKGSGKSCAVIEALLAPSQDSNTGGRIHSHKWSTTTLHTTSANRMCQSISCHFIPCGSISWHLSLCHSISCHYILSHEDSFVTMWRERMARKMCLGICK